MKKRILYDTLAFLWCLFLSVSCENKDQKTLEPHEKVVGDSIPAFVFKNVEKWYSEDASLKMKMQAPLEMVYQDDNRVSTVLFPEGIKISMYDKFGLRETVLRADTGRYMAVKQIFSAVGNVEVINFREKQRVNTSELNWNQRLKEIYTSKPIKITTPYEVLNGVGMTSNEEFSKYKVWKPIGTFVLRENEQAIPLDSSQVARKQRSVIQNSRTLKQLKQQNNTNDVQSAQTIHALEQFEAQREAVLNEHFKHNPKKK